MKINILALKSERLFLRPLEFKDSSEYSELGVSYRSMGKINTLVKAKKWLTKSINSEDSCEIGIFLKDEQKLIGTIELCHMRWFDFKAGELCYTVHKNYREKGIATEAVSQVIDFCFKKMKFRKVYADTVPSNIASQRVLEKLGFKLEGTIRERHFKKGKWVDELDYGLLKKEWNKTK